jgi:hypothetical protein
MKTALLFLFACTLSFSQITRSGGGRPKACVGSPGNTNGIVGELCHNAGVVYSCAQSGGCTLAAHWNALATVNVPVTISTTSPVTVAAWGFYYNNSAGAMTFTLPAITSATVGKQYCFRNYVTRTGAITLQAPASTYIDKDGANGTAAGTLVSSGTVGDSVCVVGTSTTQYVAYVGAGTWTNN